MFDVVKAPKERQSPHPLWGSDSF